MQSLACEARVGLQLLNDLTDEVNGAIKLLGGVRARLSDLPHQYLDDFGSPLLQRRYDRLDRSDPIINGNDLALLLSNWQYQCEWPLSDWRPPDCGYLLEP